MRFSASFVALVAPLLVSAVPIRRQAASSTAAATDLLVLQFADVLEQMESTFYSQALAQFQSSDFVSAGFSDPEVAIQQFTSIQIDESTHDTILQSTIQSLGGEAITSCQFDFSSVLTDVQTMAATARVVENLGVAAYLGAASMVSDPVLLTAAASILTVEARHQTILNVLNGGSAIPQAFDIPFSPSEVLAVASPFISGCDLPIPANPTLSITNTGTVAPGTQLTFSSTALNSSVDPSTLSCQMMLGGADFAIVLPYSQCVVPSGINGPVAIYVTSDSQPLSNNIVQQETNDLVAGPTMAFIDTVPQDLSSLARSGTLSSSASSSDSSSVVSVSSADATATVAIGTSAAATATVITSAADATATDSADATATDSADATATDSADATATDSAAATVSASIGTSTATTTISPADASSIIASALASPSASAIVGANNAAPSPSVVPGIIVMGTGTVASLPQA